VTLAVTLRMRIVPRDPEPFHTFLWISIVLSSHSVVIASPLAMLAHDDGDRRSSAPDKPIGSDRSRWSCTIVRRPSSALPRRHVEEGVNMSLISPREELEIWESPPRGVAQTPAGVANEHVAQQRNLTRADPCGSREREMD
jgi:hypothetical protein